MMMASESPRTRTASVSTVDSAHGTHSFRIARYSLHQEAGGVNGCFYSAIFTVGGYGWRIRYCPDGEDPMDKTYDSIFLELACDNGKILEGRVIYELRMVNPATGLSYSRKDDSCLEAFESNERPLSTSMELEEFHRSKRRSLSQGFTVFVRKDEQHKYLQDDCLVIECDVTVVRGLQVKEASVVTSGSDIQLPPSHLSHDLRRLLESEEEADVTFKVKEEIFRAHKIMLAMQSPVFKAELYGPMRRPGDKGTTMAESIPIQGMDPAVFKALLHFIYTDTFPRMEDLVEDDDDDEEEEEDQDMIEHLLVAADRYGMESLKAICEGILCKSLDVESVAYTLALAGQHHCSKLKSACIEFIISSGLMDVCVSEPRVRAPRESMP